MMILKKDDKGRWVARNTRTLHGLRVSLATFLLQRRRASRCREFYVAFTDGEEEVLAFQYRKYFATKRRNRDTHAIKMLGLCVEECNSSYMVADYSLIPNVGRHDLTERFTVIKPIRLKPRPSIKFF